MYFPDANRYCRQQWYRSAHSPLLWCKHRHIAPNEECQECTARNQTAFLKTWFAKRTSEHSKGVVRRQPSGALSREMNEQINLRTMLFYENSLKNNTLLLSTWSVGLGVKDSPQCGSYMSLRTWQSSGLARGEEGRVAELVRPPALSSPQRKSLKSKLSRYESATKFYCYELPATPVVARRTQNFV